MKTKIETVALKDLRVNMFVRQALNEDHALYLAELVEHGEKLPPIKITRERVVVDGRHRIEAHTLNNRTEIEAEIVEVGSETELITEAYKANVGGALPPSRQDTEHTVMLLLEHGETKKRIGELLALPPGMARKYVTEVQSRMSRAKLQRAADAVTSGGLTVAKAAEQHSVDLEKLKEFMSGYRRRHKQGVAEMRRKLTWLYRSVSQKNARLLRSLIEKFEDGDVNERQVREIVVHLANLQKNSARAVADWEKRFVAMTVTVAKTA